MTTSLQDGTMVDKIAQFDLPKEMADSEQKKPWPSGIYAKTLFKKHDLRVVLISMQNAAHMKEHHADGTLSIQVLKGHLHVSVNGKSHDLPTGTLFTLGHSIRHDVEAKGDSAFLLTISWPSADELAAMKHRGYGS
jgi:quercetin dioxygenase-like cupin family protein